MKRTNILFEMAKEEKSERFCTSASTSLFVAILIGQIVFQIIASVSSGPNCSILESCTTTNHDYGN